MLFLASISALSSAAAKHPFQEPNLGTLIPGQTSASPAFGLPPDEPTDRDYQALSDVKAMKTGRALAACVVKGHPKDATAFVLARGRPGQSAIGSQFKAGLETCLGKQMDSVMMRFSSGSLQALLAEAVLAQNPPQQNSLPALSEQQAKSLGDEAHSALEQTATCVARMRPDHAVYLLSTAPDSASESQAFEMIMPVLKDCIDPHQAFRASRTAVRFALALATFHRMYDRSSGEIMASKAN